VAGKFEPMFVRRSLNQAQRTCIRASRPENGSRPPSWQTWCMPSGVEPGARRPLGTGYWMSGTSSFGAGFQPALRMINGCPGRKPGGTAGRAARETVVNPGGDHHHVWSPVPLLGSPRVVRLRVRVVPANT
jgi:hypothetical protein